MRQFDIGVFPDDWNHECEQWITLLVVYHAAQICLHGPENNMIEIGRDNFEPPVASHMKKFTRDVAVLDRILSNWSNSSAFAIGLKHADIVVSLIKAKIEKGRSIALENYDTQFFSYCCCQVVLA